MEKEQVRVSVRNLVEFILRSGDLDNRRGSFADKEALAKGSRLHRKIQKQMSGAYRAEMPLSYIVEYEDFSILVEGRADGIIDEGDKVTIDEIKGVYRKLSLIQEPLEVHLAQAKCYAYIYGTQKFAAEDLKTQKTPNGIYTMTVQMTYSNLETEETLRFQREYTLDELRTWFQNLVDEYAKWIRWHRAWKSERNASMKNLEFPFPYREGQREVVTSVYRTILRNKQLFIQAPTGVGKTMSTVFPAVRSLGEEISEKIFYLTAKTITRTVAREAFGILKQQGLRCKVMVLTAKEKMCVCEQADCNPMTCPRAKGHFDRVNEAVFALLQQEISYDRDTILKWSEQYQVCPYEMSLDLATWVDGVICDYNYVFDPEAQLRRFFADKSKGKYVFLIDEAHNLVERGREMYSAALYKEDFLRMKNLIKSHRKSLERVLERCNRQLLEMKRECETYQKLETLSSFSISLTGLMGELEEYLEDLEHGQLRTEVLDFYFQVRSFLNIYDLVDENYVMYAQHDEDGRFRVKLYCVNPAVNLQKCMDKGICTVFFSATLLPIQYYKKLLSGQADDYAIYAKTPFAPEQKCLLIGRDVSTRYTRRGAQEYFAMAEYIHQIISAHRGNYMIFFPSYKMLEDVYEIYRENFQFGGIQVLVQTPNMQEAEREEFLKNFEVDKDENCAEQVNKLGASKNIQVEKNVGERELSDRVTGTKNRASYVLGFCVMGGIFSEGIDLTGERLVGAIIVGTGLPQVSYERELLKQFYDDKEENGFDYAYRFPGMNKVLQSAGRVIRTKEDRGVIVLLDERFGYAEYRNLFPREWENFGYCTRGNVRGQVEGFWSECES